MCKLQFLGARPALTALIKQGELEKIILVLPGLSEVRMKAIYVVSLVTDSVLC